MGETVRVDFKPGVYRDNEGNLYYVLGRFSGVGALLCIPQNGVYRSLMRLPKTLQWERDFLAPGTTIEDAYRFR